jgi:hypothetical protein
MMPPEDMEPSELFLRLQQRPRPSDVVDYPDPAMGKLRIQVLTMSEQDTARLKAYEMIAKKLKPEDRGQAVIQEGVYADAVAREALCLACVSVKPIREDAEIPTYSRIFPDADSIARLLPSREVGALFHCYEMIQQRIGPVEREIMTKEEETAWILKLGRGAAAYPLVRLRWLQLVDLTTSMAERLCGLSDYLESQLSNLPPTLAADLKAWHIGIGSFGQPAATSDDSTTSSPDGEIGVTMTEAVRLFEIAKNEQP